MGPHARAPWPAVLAVTSIGVVRTVGNGLRGVSRVVIGKKTSSISAGAARGLVARDVRSVMECRP